MNLIKDIENFFSQNEHFDDFTKIRYIYLYVCKVFSYDTRFYSHVPSLKEEIYNKKVDVTNVKEVEAVCSTVADALKDILDYFGFESEKVYEESDTFSHVYTIVKCMNNNMEYNIKLDPTLKHDVTRVKLDSPTLGFTDMDEHNDFIDAVAYSDKLIKTYQEKINHDEHYDTIKIKELNAVINESAMARNLTNKELFFEKLEYVMALVNIRKDLKQYSDIDYYYSYLIRNLELNDNIRYPYVRPAVFYSGEKYTDIIWLTMVSYPDTPLEMIYLNKEEDGFKARKIGKEEAKNLLETYDNFECAYLFEQFVEKMPNENTKSL